MSEAPVADSGKTGQPGQGPLGRAKKKRVGVRIDMTPMVDVAFLLLIFFMVTTVFRRPLAMEVNMPEPDAKPALAEIEASEAVSLFVERAKAADPTFELSESNADAVASPFAVIVSASDGSDDEASLTFTVDVANVNDAPAVATQLPLSIVKVSEVFSLDVSASFVDPDGDALTFSLQQGSLPSV